MQPTSSRELRLNADERRALRDLHQMRPWHNVKIPALYLVAGLLGALIVSSHSSLIRLPAYVGMSFLLLGLGVLMHDGAHGLLFRRSSVNDAVARALAATLLISFTQFRHAHLAHHRHALTTDDPDRYFYRFNILFTILLGHLSFFGATLSHVIVAPPRVRRVFFVEAALTAAVLVALLVVCARHDVLPLFVHVYLVPYILIGPILLCRFVAEHFECTPTNDFLLARTIRSNAALRWIWSNINFHTVHHFYPSIPYYNLPAAHSVIEPILRQEGGFVDSGYLGVLSRGLRKYGLAAPAYWTFPHALLPANRRRRPSIGSRSNP